MVYSYTGIHIHNLTLGKVYDVSESFTFRQNYSLIDDSGLFTLHPKYLFITLEEYRNNKLNSII